jgi:hypothetical protein
MREIKFRTWDTAGKFFECFDLHEIPHGCTTCPYTAQQYTGIKDKNGKEIYEGDILKTQGQLIGSYFREGGEELPAYPNNNIYTWLSKVIWDNGYASFLLEYINQPEYKGRGKFRDEMIGTALWAEIVGNIFETPELLEAAR